MMCSVVRCVMFNVRLASLQYVGLLPASRIRDHSFSHVNVGGQPEAKSL